MAENALATLMILDINTTIVNWEALAVVQLCQHFKAGVSFGADNLATSDILDIMECADIAMSLEHEGGRSLSFDGAYRLVEDGTMGYVEALAQASNLQLPEPVQGKVLDRSTGSYVDVVRAVELPISLLQAPLPTTTGGIVVCPYALKRELDLPIPLWRSIVKHLRSYGERVTLMGDSGKRLDIAAFHENDILSNGSMRDKIAMLASAKLIVGVPNAFLWLATAWQKHMVCIYPEHIPARRWFPWSSVSYGVLEYQSHMLQTPIVLAGLRSLITKL